MNCLYSTICEIEGDVSLGVISSVCRLVDNERVVKGRWGYQKVELCRFAFRYNESSTKNFIVKANPLSGEFGLGMGWFGASGEEEQKKIRESITDICNAVGEES